MSDLSLSLKIKGDASGATAAVNQVRGSVDALAQSERGAAQESTRLNEGMTRMASTASGLGAALGGLVGLIGGGALFAGFLNAAKGSEQTFAALEAGVRATGGAAGYTAQQLSDLSNELMKVSTYDDDAIAGAEKILLTFKQIKGDSFREATSAILDMSTVMGVDLREASIQVGKALNDPAQGLSALTRVGVMFTDNQRDAIFAMQQMGDMAGAQGIILDELKSEFGGAAQAATDTFGGALTQLHNTIGNLMEGDGTGLVGAKNTVQELNAELNDPAVVAGFSAITAGVVTLTGKLIEGVSWLGKFAAGIGEIAAGASGFGARFDAYQTKIDDTSKKLKELQSTIAAVKGTPALQNRFNLGDLQQQAATLTAQLSALKQAQMDNSFATQANSAGQQSLATTTTQTNDALRQQNAALSVQRGAAVSVASVLNGREWAEFDTGQKKAAQSTKAANAALREQKQAATDAARAQKALADEIQRINDTIDPFNKTARDMFDALDAIDKAYQNGTISAQQWQEMQDGIIEKMGGAQKAIGDTTETLKTQKPAIDEYAELWKNALKRVDDAFVDLWKGAFSSFSDFRQSLTNAFKEMLAQMANAAITRPIVVSITGAIMGGGSGNALASTAGQALTGGNSSGVMLVGGNPYSSLLQTGMGYAMNYGAAYLGGAGTQQAAMLASQTGAFGYQGANLTYGSLTNGGSMIGSAAGLAGMGIGGYLGGTLGAKYGAVGAGVGTALGGVGGVAAAGAIGGAVAGTGALAGAGAALAAIGPVGWAALAASAIASVVGGRKQDHSSSGMIDYGANTQQNTGGDKPNEDTDKARDGITSVFQSLNQMMDAAGWQSNAAIQYDISQKYGFRGQFSTDGKNYNEFHYSDVTAGLKDLIQKIVASATGDIPAWTKTILSQVQGDINSTLTQFQAVMQISTALSNNPVADARADYATATATPKTASELYQEQTASLRDLTSQFSYSEQSVQALSAAFAQNQQMAYQMTTAYLQAADAINGSIGSLKDKITQDMMSEQQLYDYQKSQAEALAASIRGMTDPTQITQTVAQIENLTNSAWQSLASDQKQAMGNQFLKFLDDTNTLAQDRINAGLKNVDDTQKSLNAEVNRVMADSAAAMRAAADKQAQAAAVIADAANNFRMAVSAMSIGMTGGEVSYA